MFKSQTELFNDQTTAWVTKNIAQAKKDIEIYKEAKKRFLALRPYAQKASEGEFKHLLGWSAGEQVDIALKDMDRRIKEAEKTIKEGEDFLKKGEE